VLVVVDVAGLVDQQYRNAVLDAVSAPQSALRRVETARSPANRDPNGAEGTIVEG